MKAIHLAGAALLLAAPVARADDFTPEVSFSVHDEPPDGMGAAINASSFTGLIRVQSTRVDRAMQEFNVTPAGGRSVSSASIHGQIANNNAGGAFPRTFRFVLYAADGVAALADFQTPGIAVGTASWPAPTPPLDFTFDATSAVSTLVSGGATRIGLRVEGTSDNLFPCILSAGTVLTIQSGAPGCVADIAGGPCGPNGLCPDGGVTIEDLLAYLALYNAGDARADVDDGSGANHPDGGVTIEDLLYFLVRYAAGC